MSIAPAPRTLSREDMVALFIEALDRSPSDPEAAHAANLLGVALLKLASRTQGI